MKKEKRKKTASAVFFLFAFEVMESANSHYLRL